MPTYEYRCTQCRHQWSQTESLAVHKRARPACPQCGAKTVERVFSPFFAKTVRKS